MPCGQPDQERLTEDITLLTRQFGRYGYRMIAGMLNNSGWQVNHKRIERIWRRDGGGSGKAPVGRFRDDTRSPTETAEKGPALAERRILRPAEAGTCNHVCTS